MVYDYVKKNASSVKQNDKAGVFISESMNNGRVPKEDVEAAIKMLEGAYQSHIDEMEKIKKAKSNGYPRKKG